MKSLHFRSLHVVLLGLLLTNCSRFDDSAIEVDRLCSLADTAFRKQDYGNLLQALEKQFQVEKSKMRVTEQGIFIPDKDRFVEEQGYFLAKPGVALNEKGTDPFFSANKGCIYRYRIKG